MEIGVSWGHEAFQNLGHDYPSLCPSIGEHNNLQNLRTQVLKYVLQWGWGGRGHKASA